MELTEINLVVSRVESSRRFYEWLGCTFRDLSGPGLPGPACMAVSGPVPVSLHSVGFAGWWDPSRPTVAPGSAVLDLTLDDGPPALDALADGAPGAGGSVVSASRDMPWGQRYAIIADPDGHRWGLKSRPSGDAAG